ncbi:hypothetical protein CRX72_21945 [Pantoea sp. BRM17]|nr:hypothetical protein CRX72_21945 [Pantoea sp. BRM17]
MQDIRFSIVIPAYNASKSIITTLDCVKAQSYRNFEVIIVDDKSADAAELAQVVQGRIAAYRRAGAFQPHPLFGAFCTAKQTHSTIFGISVMVRGILRRKSNNGLIFRNKTDFFPWPARATV